MKKTEMHYHAERNPSGQHEYMDVQQELSNNRAYIRFQLMENRWRSVDEAADYLRWAASELEKLK